MVTNDAFLDILINLKIMEEKGIFCAVDIAKKVALDERFSNYCTIPKLMEHVKQTIKKLCEIGFISAVKHNTKNSPSVFFVVSY